jgi:hypothetical protein
MEGKVNMEWEDICIGDFISFHFNSTDYVRSGAGSERDYQIVVTSIETRYHASGIGYIGAFHGHYLDGDSSMVFLRPYVSNLVLLERGGQAMPELVGVGRSGGEEPWTIVSGHFYSLTYNGNSGTVRTRICKAIEVNGETIKFHNYRNSRQITIPVGGILRAVEVVPFGEWDESNLSGEYMDIDEQYFHTEAGYRWVEKNAPKTEYPTWQGPRLVREWSSSFVIE